MKKKLIPILLVLSLLFACLSACGTTAQETADEAESAAAEESAETTETETEAAEASEEPEESAEASEAAEAETETEAETEPEASEEAQSEASEEAEEEETAEAASLEVTLPLVEETETITFWWGGFDGGNFGNDSPAATLVSQEMMERTNVNVEYTSYAGTSAEEMRNLMFASDEYPDLIKEPGEYSGGLEKGYTDEIFMDLTDLLEEYAPNYYALISADDASRKIVTTDNGYILAFYQVYTQASEQGNGLILRKDYLDQLGLDMPVTYDDWTEYLTLCRDEFGATQPYYMTDTGMSASFLSGFGLSTDWYQVDGEIQYAPVQDSFRDYLQLMSEWYAEGLISQDFISHKAGSDTTTPVVNGETVAVTDRSSVISDYMNTIEGSEFVAVTEPVPNEGDEQHFYTGGSMVNSTPGIALSTQCSNVELCMAWMDYLYTQEGGLLNSYGVEGETYTVQDDGSYAYTELLTNDADGLPLTLTKLKYLDGLAGGTGLYDPKCETVGVNENTLAADSVWKNDGAYVLPNFELSEDEGTQYSNIMADIETYVDEMILRYITGAESLDTYDEYVQNVMDMGLADAIALKQAGFDRYNSR